MWDLISPPKIFGAVCVKQRRHEDDRGTGASLVSILLHCYYLLSEFNDKRQLVGLDKTQEVLLGHRAIKRVATFIKLEHIKHLDTNIKTTHGKIPALSACEPHRHLPEGEQ